MFRWTAVHYSLKKLIPLHKNSITFLSFRINLKLSKG